MARNKRIAEMTPEEAAAQRADWAARKKQERDAARVKKEALKADSTPNVFWTLNRSTSNHTRIVELWERQDYVFALLADMESAMGGNHGEDEELFVKSVQDEVDADFTQFGTVAIEVGLLEFWKYPNLFANLMATGNEATKHFLRYGIISAIPSHKLHQWQTWLSKRNSVPQQQHTSGYTALACSNPNCPTPYLKDAVKLETALAYNGKYLCDRCRSAELSARAQASPLIRRPAGPEDVFDSWGRIKNE